MLIPPVTVKSTYFENETIRAVWKDAAIALQNATSFYIVGYSLPESDLGMRFFLAENPLPEETPIQVVDIEENITQHYENLLGRAGIDDKFVHKNEPISNFVDEYCADTTLE